VRQAGEGLARGRARARLILNGFHAWVAAMEEGRKHRAMEASPPPPEGGASAARCGDGGPR
jgi:hypothetical protein